MNSTGKFVSKFWEEIKEKLINFKEGMEYKEISIYDEKLRNFEEKVIRIIEIDKFLKKRCKKKIDKFYTDWNRIINRREFWTENNIIEINLQ